MFSVLCVHCLSYGVFVHPVLWFVVPHFMKMQLFVVGIFIYILFDLLIINGRAKS